MAKPYVGWLRKILKAPTVIGRYPNAASVKRHSSVNLSGRSDAKNEH
jgi:hypothetical protein